MTTRFTSWLEWRWFHISFWYAYAFRPQNAGRADVRVILFCIRNKARFGRWFRKTFNLCQISAHYTGDWVCNTHHTDDDEHNPKAVEKAFRYAEEHVWKGRY